MESNYSGGLSHVSSQPAVPLDTCNTSGQQENVFGNQFSTVDSRNHYKEFTIFLHQVVQDPPSTTGFFLQATGTGTHFPGHEDLKQRHNSNADICRKAVDHELSTVDIPQNSMVGQERQQISKLQFFRTPHSFLCWNRRFKNEATTCSDFPWRNYVKDQRSGDGLFIGRIEISAISLWKGFSKLRDAGREDCFCSEEDHPEFTVQEESQPRGTESPERGSVSMRNTDRLHDLRLLASCWCS